jgi:hypothetical protein
MIESLTLSTLAGDFFAHHYSGESRHLFVFITGLMEPKCGLFYIWNQMARQLQERGHNALLFDLAGQGDSLLPFSFDLWREQKKAIQQYFKEKEIHFVARGIGTILLQSGQNNIAISPSLQEPLSSLLKQVRWKNSPFCKKSLTPAEPHALLAVEEECFHRLGAEAACIGSLQLPLTFVEDLLPRLSKSLPEGAKCYEADGGHPLFDKQAEREALMQAIFNDLEKRDICTRKF